MISGFLFLTWRIFEIVTLIPTVGMLAWFGNDIQISFAKILDNCR